ncbi:MAG: hypothetical protein VW577_05115 [Pelagibacteraceae bacterium]
MATANHDKHLEITRRLGVNNMKRAICTALGDAVVDEIGDLYQREGNVTWFDAFAMYILEVGGMSVVRTED